MYDLYNSSILGLWEALNKSSELNKIVHIDDRTAVGAAVGRVVSHLSDDTTRIQVYDGMMKFPLEHVQRLMQSSRSTTSGDEQLHIMKRIADEINAIATLLHVFAFPLEQSPVNGEMTESMQADCEIPEAIFSIIRKAWPFVEIAASKWGDDEVRLKGNLSELFCWQVQVFLMCILILSNLLKNVAKSLGTFLLKLLPSSCEHFNNLKLSKELCQLAVVLLQRPRTSGRCNFDAVVSFMGALLATYGKAVVGSKSSNSTDNSLYTKEMEHILKSMMWKIIEAEQSYLGHVWSSPINGSEQGNGQSAYEIKSAPIPKSPSKKSNMESIPGVLSIMKQGLVSCPVFVLTISAVAPAENAVTIDHDERRDLLIRRAAGTASMSLEEYHDADIVQSAVTFLMALV